MPVKSYMKTSPASVDLFRPPRVRLASVVLTDRSPEWRNPRPAWVVSHINDTEMTVTRLLPNGSLETLTAFHRDDPRLANLTDQFGPNGEACVWMESEGGPDPAAMAMRLANLEILVGSLRAQVESLSKTVEESRSAEVALGRVAPEWGGAPPAPLSMEPEAEPVGRGQILKF